MGRIVRSSFLHFAFLLLHLLLCLCITPFLGIAQQKQVAGDSLVISNPYLKLVVDLTSGKLSCRFTSGAQFENATAYVQDVKAGRFSSAGYSRHSFTTDDVDDPLGKGICVNLSHEDAGKAIRLVQYITVYESRPFILLGAQAIAVNKTSVIETRDFSPFTILPAEQGRITLPGSDALLTDYPFDNDNWVDVISRHWPTGNKEISGISYELASAYDEKTMNGFVIGSLVHDFWKTGIRYGSGTVSNVLDSLIVYGGAATKDDPALPDSYGGKDGTHDYVQHGTQAGESVYSPLIYLSASADIRNDLLGFGNAVKKISGSLKWKKSAPFYWNSFGVEGVLGYEKVMMPLDVAKVSDFIQSLPNFNKSTQPVLSIDSYDQGIYTTEVLKSVGRYGKKKGQQMGFYFIPFALWTWKNNISEAKLTNTDYPLKEVILLDENRNYVPYKDGEWGAFPIDPTHPYTRAFIIEQLKKAKAIDARFIKIDFLSAGALESTRRYDPQVRSGIQAYNYGMKMLKRLVDSIMGPDVFITQAISPLFPHQYAHTRFLSTDVYSHLRNDMPGFPHYGSTSASMISATHFWWTQGTLWPYTNMDVVVMKNFQKNKDLTEQEVKVRIFSMMTLGSLFGDGTDYRNREAADRARKFLNNAAVCDFFSKPKAFTPLRFPVGNGQSQQLSFYLPGDTLLVSAFNFDKEKKFTETFQQTELGWKKENRYSLQDLLTGQELGRIDKGQTSFTIDINNKDAVMIRIVPEHTK
jgi:alpha-galactosidase